MSAPHTRGECDWCFRPLGDVADQFNGGTGHPECVAWAWEAVSGGGHPDAMPWARPRRIYREDGAARFLERLGREAARLGISRRKLAVAVARARP